MKCIFTISHIPLFLLFLYLYLIYKVVIMVYFCYFKVCAFLLLMKNECAFFTIFTLPLVFLLFLYLYFTSMVIINVYFWHFETILCIFVLTKQGRCFLYYIPTPSSICAILISLFHIYGHFIMYTLTLWNHFVHFCRFHTKVFS